MSVRIFGKGFNYSQDGPGNRLVYHLSGCNMRCRWCSNPEGMDGTAGKTYTIDEVVDECRRSRPMFFGGGGVTFTGGEATLQFDALQQVLHRLQAEHIHTALETNGTSPELALIAENVDYLFMDFKHHSSELLQMYTGLGNETVKHNFEYFCRTGRQLHIRIPLINGFNADNPEAFATYFSQHNTGNVVFELLPYHEYGKDKWKTPYQIVNGHVTSETVEHFRSVFTAYGLKLTTT